MKAPECITIDFETQAIEPNRPDYPPQPVGVAIGYPGSEPYYACWDHPGDNNCTHEEARRHVAAAWMRPEPKLFHNAKFDIAVATERMGMPPLDPLQVHDTMFLAYLANPHSRKLGLKELAESELHWPPDERDEVSDWLWAHKKELGITSKKKLGGYIAKAPAALVAPYAVGDVARTRGLFNHLWPLIQNNHMDAAYKREQLCMPIFMENERIGMRVDYALEDETQTYWRVFEYVEDWLRGELGASGLNFDADEDVASVLLSKGIVPKDKWALTKSGKLSMSKDNLMPDMFTRQDIASALGYRNRLATCVNMFIQPWLDQAKRRNGYISTTWNQVRNPEGGTRTGRPSTQDPNLLNISKDFEGRDDGYVHPSHLSVPALPRVRKFILPDEGEVFLHRDFDGQELRLFAHFEQGDLWEQYQRDAAVDPHKFVGAELMRVAGREIDRTKVKTLNFQGLYGGGVPALQRKLRCSLDEAKELKAFHNQALPGRMALNEAITAITNRGEPIKTWGGRLYYPEPPGEDGRSKVYKLINYLIQGSAADLTKQALVDWYYTRGRLGRFLVTVYDEINISAAPAVEHEAMLQLKCVMEEDRLTVPMRSSGKRGPGWGELTKCP